ncbi:hypothetical protein IFM89_029623 [Coptis chinensis]|uniref:Membrane insertase YidC/Oxa/ALB C-terminal domain-containing protein n=1 Tax=Coptis chinensis TaxID=261450 RepID=A0A835IG51_9MAGN|nr:hypothetical protein IFM89_029623 [Coptis chinensis]
MAYRRSLSTRVTLLTQRVNPSLSSVLHDDDSEKKSSAADSCQPENRNFWHRGIQNYIIKRAIPGPGALFRVRGLLSYSLPVGLGPSLSSYSTTTGEEGSDKVEYMSDVAAVELSGSSVASDVTDIMSDNSLEVAASSVASEVATAAADSFFPIAALQYLIDGIHSLTGLNWWASIALTTILIRGATIPVLINQLKCMTKLTVSCFRSLLFIYTMDPNAMAEGQKRMWELFREYGVTPFTPLKGLFIQGPIFISFYLAITNMVEKVPSFKEGGAFWFTDLTTPDSLYILPVLTGLSFLITVECNVQEGLEGNPVAGTIKIYSRVLAVLTVPITMTLPKAVFCYWLTSNLFSLGYGLVIKSPRVKELLKIPVIPTAPGSRTQPPFSPPSISFSSSSVISEGKTLESQVKQRKEDKKL